jgi:5-(carboxyamino)imidazole ribonucleotide mutase
VKYDDLRNKFLDYKKQVAEKVFEKDKKLNEKLMSS